MDEHDQFVLLQFNNQVPTHSHKHRQALPNANSLFKQIEDETEAIKELQNKKNNNNIYEKVKKSLEDKLISGRLTRGMSTDEQINIRDMISTCNQRKHIRSFDVWKKDAETNSQRYKARSRNYSAKQSKNDSVGRHEQKVRPKSSKISTPGTRSTELFRYTARDALNLSFLSPIPENKPSKLKKHTKVRNFSKIIENKQNEQPDPTKIYYLGFNHLKREAIETKKVREKKQQRNRVQFKSRFEGIINHCKFEKKAIKSLDKKIDHFEYFCDKVTKDKSVIKNFCNRMESVKFMFDDQFN